MTPKAKVDASLIDTLGFETVDTGLLRDSWRCEPEAAAYVRLYTVNPSNPDEAPLEAPGAPVSADKLLSALAGAQRVRVADRTY